jgi:hypothetical protein
MSQMLKNPSVYKGPIKDKSEDIAYMLLKLYQAMKTTKELYNEINKNRFENYPEDEYDWHFFQDLVDEIECDARKLCDRVKRVPQIEVFCPPEM